MLRHSESMGPGVLRTCEGGMPQKSGGSMRAAAVRLGDVVVRRMLARQAVGMPREKCLCRRSLERGEAGVVLGVPSISVMKAVVRGVPT